ncbi:MAG TPA: hypothetical protein VE860_27440 [Chthoniobacterales bacterium]|jgi:hypothetical protein|nr:hypothetical protein [Chthoniobacterales bacterium]
MKMAMFVFIRGFSIVFASEIDSLDQHLVERIQQYARVAQEVVPSSAKLVYP